MSSINSYSEWQLHVTVKVSFVSRSIVTDRSVKTIQNMKLCKTDFSNTKNCLKCVHPITAELGHKFLLDNIQFCHVSLHLSSACTLKDVYYDKNQGPYHEILHPKL